MLPQFLVQNDLISNPSKTDFNLDWFLAAPIVNLNFFHIEKLLDEQEHYRQLLRPWTPIEDGITTNNYSTLKTHEYGYATGPISNLEPLKIYAGTLVGRINTTSTSPSSFIAATQTLTNYYIKYDSTNRSWSWQENYDPAYPAIVRPNYANLNNNQEFPLDGTKFVLKNGVWSYNAFSNDSNNWQMSLGWTDISKPHPILMRDTDIIFGRIIYTQGGEDYCLANVPITLDVQWNTNTHLFVYTFSFKDQNFPSSAKVELY